VALPRSRPHHNAFNESLGLYDIDSPPSRGAVDKGHPNICFHLPFLSTSDLDFDYLVGLFGSVGIHVHDDLDDKYINLDRPPYPGRMIFIDLLICDLDRGILWSRQIVIQHRHGQIEAPCGGDRHLYTLCSWSRDLVSHLLSRLTCRAFRKCSTEGIIKYSYLVHPAIQGYCKRTRFQPILLYHPSV
jgi:hypothetical protein